MAEQKENGHCCAATTGPLDAMKGPTEKLLYVLCLQSPENEETKCGYLATIDADPTSPSYSKVIHRLYTTDPRDELHHFGWNSCVSCKDTDIKRKYLIIPGVRSGNIYIVDTHENPAQPKIFKTIPGSLIAEKFDITYPHTVHCVPSGDVMISYMGDAKLGGKGSFLLLDGHTFEPKGLWNQNNPKIFGYDFWYQPRHNVMVSSELGAPRSFMKGFHTQDVENGEYGNRLHFWDWNKRELISSQDLGAEGAIPLELRFLHNPDAAEAFVGASLGSSVYNIHKDNNGKWQADMVIQIPRKTVENWLLPTMPSLITDILISLDDKFLYFSNFFHGDVRQYDISNPKAPKFVSSVFLGGSICKGEAVKVVKDLELVEQPERPVIGGKTIHGGPNMLQMSRDGKRLYVTMSLLTPWDKQFYPQMVKEGSGIILLDCSSEGMKINKEFYVDLGSEPDGAIRGHEVRYPGGDCSSDIWV